LLRYSRVFASNVNSQRHFATATATAKAKATGTGTAKGSLLDFGISDWVAVAGLNEVKEATGFACTSLQPRPPLPALTIINQRTQRQTQNIRAAERECVARWSPLEFLGGDRRATKTEPASVDKQRCLQAESTDAAARFFERHICTHSPAAKCPPTAASTTGNRLLEIDFGTQLATGCCWTVSSPLRRILS